MKTKPPVNTILSVRCVYVCMCVFIPAESVPNHAHALSFICLLFFRSNFRIRVECMQQGFRNMEFSFRYEKRLFPEAGRNTYIQTHISVIVTVYLFCIIGTSDIGFMYYSAATLKIKIPLAERWNTKMSYNAIYDNK